MLPLPVQDVDGPLTNVHDFWLTGAQLVDGTGADPLPRADLHIRDGLIAGVGPAPANAEAIDVAGCTLTPGLIDAHVHLGIASSISDLVSHRLSVAEIAADIFANAARTLDAGFTTVRDTGGIDGGLPRAIARGRVRGPRVIPCGPLQCQRGGHGHLAADWEPSALWNTHHIPGLLSMASLSDSPDDMRANVREAFRRGAEFIKLCVTGGVVSSHDRLSDTQLTVEEIAVAVHEAAARGTYVTVHAHNNAGVRNAVRAGALCVEHGSELDEETAALMATHQVAHVPTLAVVEQLVTGAVAMGLEPAVVERARAVQHGQIEGLRASLAAGVTVGLGSDLIGPDQDGRGQELVLRSQVQTPMAALVAATATNARILRVDDRLGTLEPGKAADVVAWQCDPLADPQAFADSSNAVLIVKSGRIVKDDR